MQLSLPSAEATRCKLRSLLHTAGSSSLAAPAWPPITMMLPTTPLPAEAHQHMGASSQALEPALEQAATASSTAADDEPAPAADAKAIAPAADATTIAPTADAKATTPPLLDSFEWEELDYADACADADEDGASAMSHDDHAVVRAEPVEEMDLFET